MDVCKGLKELICAYADRELSEDEIVIVEKHMETCECCKKFLEIQYNQKRLVKRAMNSIEFPNGLREKIIKILESECEDYKSCG